MAVSSPFSSPGSPSQSLLSTGMLGKMASVICPKRVPGVRGSKVSGSEKPLIAQLPDAGYTLAM